MRKNNYEETFRIKDFRLLPFVVAVVLLSGFPISFIKIQSVLGRHALKIAGLSGIDV